MEPPRTGTGGDLAEELEEARVKIAQLEHALKSRIVIEQAKGIIAERLGVDVDVAFDLLRSAARSHRIKIHAVAERVVHERHTPAPVVVAIARSERARAAWMRERTEAQRERLAELERQIAEQLERVRRNRPDD